MNYLDSQGMFGAVVTPSQSQCRQFWLWCSIDRNKVRHRDLMRRHDKVQRDKGADAQYRALGGDLGSGSWHLGRGSWEGILGGDLGRKSTGIVLIDE